MVKCIKLSPDGLVAVSGSADGTLKVWDMNMRRCLYSFGDSKNKHHSKFFHKDSIWVLDVDEDF